MLSPWRVDQLLTEGVVDFELYHWENARRHRLGKEVDLGVRLRARHHDETWERTKRATFLLRDGSFMKRLLFNAEDVVPRAVRFADDLADELAGYANETGVPELSTSFNRIAYNIMKGSKRRPAIIPPHADPENLHGVVAIVGLSGWAEQGSVAPRKSAVTLLACPNLCEAVGIDPVIYGSEATQRRVTMTLAEIA